MRINNYYSVSFSQICCCVSVLFVMSPGMFVGIKHETKMSGKRRNENIYSMYFLFVLKKLLIYCSFFHINKKL